MAPSVWDLGYDEELLRFVLTQTADYLTMGISVEDQPHRELLERCEPYRALYEAEAGNV